MLRMVTPHMLGIMPMKLPSITLTSTGAPRTNSFRFGDHTMAPPERSERGFSVPEIGRRCGGNEKDRDLSVSSALTLQRLDGANPKKGYLDV
jgi:hypothetical protein